METVVMKSQPVRYFLFVVALLRYTVSIPAASVSDNSFINLDFEETTLSPPLPLNGEPVPFPPDATIPGWQFHDSYDFGIPTSTQTIATLEHVGIDSWKLVNVEGLQHDNWALAGRYSVNFKNGPVPTIGGEYEDPKDLPYNQISLSQSGLVPTGTISLRVLAKSYERGYPSSSSLPTEELLGVSFGNSTILAPLVSVGGNEYAIDFSLFAGQYGELTFTNLADLDHREQFVVLDNIRFSPDPVIPLPPAISLFISGIAGISLLKRLRKSDLVSGGGNNKIRQ